MSKFIHLAAACIFAAVAAASLAGLATAAPQTVSGNADECPMAVCLIALF